MVRSAVLLVAVGCVLGTSPAMVEPVPLAEGVEQVNAILGLQLLQEINGLIDGATAGVRLAFVDHEEDKAVVQYVSMGPQLPVVADPALGERLCFLSYARHILRPERAVGLVYPDPGRVWKGVVCCHGCKCLLYSVIYLK